MSNKNPLEKAIEAAEADPYGGKVMLSLEDARSISDRLRSLEALAQNSERSHHDDAGLTT